MMTATTRNAALAALKAQQGKGARYDAESAPADDLLLARRGSALFARQLAQLPDRDLDNPSLREGQTRREIIIEVCYAARAQAIALKKLREPLSTEEATWTGDMALGLSLPPRALRHLYDHSSVHLNVEYRDLSNEGWQQSISISSAPSCPVRALPLMRAREVWRAAYQLAAGVRLSELPEVARGGL